MKTDKKVRRLRQKLAAAEDTFYPTQRDKREDKARIKRETSRLVRRESKKRLQENDD